METTIWGSGFRGLDKFQYYPMTENQMEIPMENEMETTMDWVIFGREDLSILVGNLFRIQGL